MIAHHNHELTLVHACGFDSRGFWEHSINILNIIILIKSKGTVTLASTELSSHFFTQKMNNHVFLKEPFRHNCKI